MKGRRQLLTVVGLVGAGACFILVAGLFLVILPQHSKIGKLHAQFEEETQTQILSIEATRAGPTSRSARASSTSFRGRCRRPTTCPVFCSTCRAPPLRARRRSCRCGRRPTSRFRTARWRCRSRSSLTGKFAGDHALPRQPSAGSQRPWLGRARDLAALPGRQRRDLREHHLDRNGCASERRHSHARACRVRLQRAGLAEPDVRGARFQRRLKLVGDGCRSAGRATSSGASEEALAGSDSRSARQDRGRGARRRLPRRCRDPGPEAPERASPGLAVGRSGQRTGVRADQYAGLARRCDSCLRTAAAVLDLRDQGSVQAADRRRLDRRRRQRVQVDRGKQFDRRERSGCNVHGNNHRCAVSPWTDGSGGADSLQREAPGRRARYRLPEEAADVPARVARVEERADRADRRLVRERQDDARARPEP